MRRAKKSYLTRGDKASLEAGLTKAFDRGRECARARAADHHPGAEHLHQESGAQAPWIQAVAPGRPSHPCNRVSSNEKARQLTVNQKLMARLTVELFRRLNVVQQVGWLGVAMTPDFASARAHMERARQILAVADPIAERMCGVLDLAIEAILAAEHARRLEATNVVWLDFPHRPGGDD